MQLTLLGTGTSQGVPVIGCTCIVCKSSDPRDSRLRTSAMLTTEEGKKILIDCGPDFRQQMLRNKEEKVDVVLLTHEHNDHIIGLDDLRPIIFRTDKATPIYAKKRVLDQVVERFPYAFSEQKYPGAPSFELYPLYDDFSLFGVSIELIEVMHFRLPILGFRIKELAYITDASHIDEAQKEKLKGLSYLIINCLRKEENHISHFILPEILKLHEELSPQKMLLTHISHDFGLHSVENKSLPDGIELAYDGMEIFF